jgi:hypothetical protein
MQFPNSRPDAEPVILWQLQNDLLMLAEAQLGSRDATKKIYQPIFDANGPFLINTPKFDGAFACLSPNAAGYWPTTVYEMAHETVHLLNPAVANTNWLEEGVAVAFSVFALVHYKLPKQEPNLPSYQEALALVEALPGGSFSTARAARALAGALNAVTFEHLAALFPGYDECRLRRLASCCVPR